ncbi:hypothetical protein QBE53_06095 [Vallitaleaceae bacterium 9-2]
MIPTELVDEIIEETKKVFQNKQYKKPNGELGALNIYPQDIPYKKGKRDEDHYPLIVVAIEDGDIVEENNCNIAVLIGTFDDREDRQGFRDATGIANKIIERFPIRSQMSKYRLASMNYRFPAEDTREYCFITLSMTWEVPQYTPTDPLI